MNKLEGFVILHPVSTHERQEDHLDLSFHSFGRTPVEAWKRFIHPSQYEHIDFSILVQRLHDRGYRVKKASMMLEE